MEPTETAPTETRALAEARPGISSNGRFTLAYALRPLTVEDFTATYFGKQFLYAPGESGRFAALVPWADLNAILRRHRLGPPRLRLVREGAAIPSSSYIRYRTPGRGGPSIPRVKPVELAAELRNGATLVIDSIDELQDPVAELAEDIDRTLRCRIQVNMYAGWRQSPGFDLHWDDHDVLVLQVSGRKHWRVYGMTREHPLRGDRHVLKPEGAPVWDGVLESGDTMYIPRGWWHVAVPMDEPTLHLTIGLHTQTGVDLLEWFVGRMKENVWARRDVPRFASAEERRAYALQIRDEAIRHWSASIVDEYLAAMDANAGPRATFALPWSAACALPDDSSAWCVKWLPTRPLDLTARDGIIRFLFDGREWTFTSQAGALLDRMQSTVVCRCDELYNLGIDPKRVRAFVRELLEGGLVTVSGGGDPPQ